MLLPRIGKNWLSHVDMGNKTDVNKAETAVYGCLIPAWLM